MLNLISKQITDVINTVYDGVEASKTGALDKGNSLAIQSYSIILAAMFHANSDSVKVKKVKDGAAS